MEVELIAAGKQVLLLIAALPLALRHFSRCQYWLKVYEHGFLR
jgi:hypothetical protein